jgi:hypothetical protein
MACDSVVKLSLKVKAFLLRAHLVTRVCMYTVPGLVEILSEASKGLQDMVLQPTCHKLPSTNDIL